MHAKTLAAPIALLLALALCLGFALATPNPAWAMQSKSENFNSYKPKYIGAKDMLGVAMAQDGLGQGSLGYTEGWCADFVSDCAKRVGQSKAVPFNGMVSELYRATISAGGKVVTTPKAGDLVFFNFDHVGIMIDAENCISGNMGSPSKVAQCRCEWVIPGAKIVYVRPAYKSKAYQVGFKANGGTGKMSKQTIKRNKTKALKKNAFKRTGYKFVGWNTKKDGSGKWFKNRQKVKNIAKAGKTIRLYAQWKKRAS